RDGDVVPTEEAAEDVEKRLGLFEMRRVRATGEDRQLAARNLSLEVRRTLGRRQIVRPAGEQHGTRKLTQPLAKLVVAQAAGANQRVGSPQRRVRTMANAAERADQRLRPGLITAVVAAIEVAN